MNTNGHIAGTVFDASGVEGFFGEGYAHHKLLKLFGLTFEGCTFVAKTTTLHERAGNMPLIDGSVTPREWLPRCILPNFRPETFALSLRMFVQGIMLNAVGLSCPGALALFKDGGWQERTERFSISFMSTESTPEKRLAELRMFVCMFETFLPQFTAKVDLQINKSCPNVKLPDGEKLDPTQLVTELQEEVKIVHRLHIPIMWKFNILVPPSAIREAFKDNHKDGICISNTVLWGKLPNKIDWKGLFGTDISPLAEFGGGGLSGKPLLPLVADWVREARKCGIKNHINAGGGILSAKDVAILRNAGASSCFIGSVANLRWWRMRSIIKAANEEFSILV